MGQIKSKKLLKLKANSNCWICEGWTEFRFDFEPPHADKIDNDTMPVNLHLSCDKYEGELLLREPSSSEVKYSTTRMLPPGEVTYFFTINGYLILKKDAQMIQAVHAEKN